MEGDGNAKGSLPGKRSLSHGAEQQAAAVPMLPAMELAQEPEKAAPKGKSKNPNTYTVLSLRDLRG